WPIGSKEPPAVSFQPKLGFLLPNAPRGRRRRERVLPHSRKDTAMRSEREQEIALECLKLASNAFPASLDETVKRAERYLAFVTGAGSDFTRVDIQSAISILERVIEPI